MKKILIIDDDNGVHSIIDVIVRRKMPDCTFIHAYEGLDGILKACEEKPDVILLDVNMPGIDGFETCRRLKQDQRTQDIPIMIFTGMATDTEGLDSAHDCGADCVLAKPINKDDLTESLSAILDKGKKAGRAG